MNLILKMKNKNKKYLGFTEVFFCLQKNGSYGKIYVYENKGEMIYEKVFYMVNCNVYGDVLAI